MTSHVGCVLLPMLPLQVLLRQKTHWHDSPVVVVDDEGPNGQVTHLNALARRAHLRVGMRQAVARDLVPNLHAAVVPPKEVNEVIQDLVTSLQTFSPRVEADTRLLGAFTIDPEGLRRLYGGYRNWAKSIYRYLRARHWRSSIVIGFHRYRILAVAMMKSGVTVLENAKEEREQSDLTPLTSFDLPGELCESMRALGVMTLGDFLGLPSGELRSRFGENACALHDLFSESLQLPIQPQAFDEPTRVTFQIEPPDSDQHRLLFAIKGALHSLLHQIHARAEALESLKITLHLERAPLHEEKIEPAVPTTDWTTVLELIRLRLQDAALEGDVEEVELLASTLRAHAEQIGFPGEQPSRDLTGASRALARIRAAYGERSVTKASLREAHLPEASFRWDPIQQARTPTTKEHANAPMIRRVFDRPRPLPSLRPRNPEAGPSLKSDQTIEHMYGPYRISGGWWKRLVERDYYYAETEHGDLLWLFYDRPRKRWFLHGVLD